MVLADNAYSSRANRDHLREGGKRAVIPILADQCDHRLRGRAGAAGRRPSTARPTKQAAQHSRAMHPPPQAVERHREPLRETATIYLAGLHIAGTFLWSTR